MAFDINDLEGLELWRKVVLHAIRGRSPDLSQRQMAVLLTVYLTPAPHTIRGLAETLSVAKPVITRALDHLSRLEFIRRKTDEEDRRNVLVQRTVKGSVYLSEFAKAITTSAKPDQKSSSS